MDQRNSNNPFVLGGVVSGDNFAGRSRETSEIRTLAAGSRRVYLFAPRRYGKTSLLKVALEPLSDAKSLLLLWCDCLPTTSPESLAARLGEAVVRGARQSSFTEWVKHAAGLFKRLRPTLTAGPDGQVSVGLDLAPGATGPTEVEDALEAVGRLAEARQAPAAVVFDEFQQIGAWDSDHRTEAAIRTVIQHQEGIAYIFAGSQRRLLQQMFTDRARPLFQLAVPFPLGRLSRAELVPWLTQRFENTGIGATPEGIALLFDTTAGHPWATQYLSYFVWDQAAASSGAVTPESVQAGLTRALEVGETIYASEFAALTSAQRRVFMAVAREPTGTPTSADYLARHDLPSKSTTNQALKSLVEKGHIEGDAEGYFAGDPLYAEWVRRQ